MNRAPIIGDANYSHSHYWRSDVPKCGLATHMGACGWPREPGMPWCNSHLSSYLDRMKAGGYGVEQVRAFFAGQGWDAVAVATVVARYERLLALKAVPQPPEPERPVQANVVAARKPRRL